MGRALSDSSAVISFLNPQRGKWIEKGAGVGGLFPENWTTMRGYLTQGLVAEGINGDIDLGIFSTHNPSAIGVDMDDHKGHGEAYQRELFQETVHLVGCSPSLVCRSPRGIHAYWKLPDPIPGLITFPIMEQKLRALREVEIRPTYHQGLRIPVTSRLVDPGSLDPWNRSMSDYIAGAPVYHPAEVFGEDYLPERIREELQRGSHKRPSHRALSAEQAYTPLVDGASNEAFVHLLVAYKLSGLTPAQAFERFKVYVLGASPRYAGSLRNDRELETRIRSMYRKGLVRLPDPEWTMQGDLFLRIQAEEIANRATGIRSQRRRSIQALAEAVLYSKMKYRAILEDPALRTYHDFLYPWFSRNVKRGYYPLPRNYLRTIVHRYKPILEWFEEIGLVERAPFGYQAGEGICKYYTINEGI